MSGCRVDTGPPIGSVVGVGSMLPSLHNLRVAPTGASQSEPFHVQFVVGRPENDDSVKRRIDDDFGSTPNDMYVQLEVSDIADDIRRESITNEISAGLLGVFGNHNGNLGAVAGRQRRESTYVHSCSGVYKTTHEFYALGAEGRYLKDLMVKGLGKLAEEAMKVGKNDDVKLGDTMYKVTMLTNAPVSQLVSHSVKYRMEEIQVL